MNLTDITHSLALVTSAVSPTAYEVSWTDIDKTTVTAATPGSAQGVIVAATVTQIVPPPPSATVYRIVTSIALSSTAGAQTVTVNKDVSGVPYQAARAVLAINESLHYEDANGWYALDASGKRLGVGSTGANGINGGGTVLGSGTALVDFADGAPMATVVVTGQASILAGSLVYCWIKPEATADHTAGEHIVESIKVVAGDIVAGVGFTIYALCPDPAIAPQPALESQRARFSGVGADAGRGARPVGATNASNRVALLSGQWSVGWIFTQ